MNSSVRPNHEGAASWETSLKFAQFFLGLCFFAACANFRFTNISLLDQAIAYAGGEIALSKAKRLIWSGEADVRTGDGDIPLAVRSDIVPFGKVRSETWLRDKGPSTTRIMELDAAQGWTTRDGKREPLPVAMAHNEYQQFGTYELMRLVSLKRPNVSVKEIGKDTHGLTGLRVNYPELPESVLWFDKNARLAALTNSVQSPDGKGSIEQRFEFFGCIESNGVRWPREIRIFQEGKPFFDLRISSFATATQ